MTTFVYIAEPSGIELTVTAADQKQARQKAWESLTPEQRDNCECLDWVDTIQFTRETA